MVAVGLCAVMLGSGARLAILSAFVGVMPGFFAALAGLPLPFVELAALASSVVIGLLVAIARPASPGLSPQSSADLHSSMGIRMALNWQAQTPCSSAWALCWRRRCTQWESEWALPPVG